MRPAGQIAAFICENGLGHAKRTLSILNEISRLAPHLHFTIFCEDWQLKAIGRRPEFSTFFQLPLTIVSKVASLGVIWDENPAIYNDGRLLLWEDQLKKCEPLLTADLVLTDNLSGVLSVRPDAILLGSFLWSEILHSAFPSNREVQRFVKHEIELLESHHPTMISVEALAMPWVREKTRAELLPWMCKPHQSVRAPKNRIPKVGLFCGKTRPGQKIEYRILQILSPVNSYEIINSERFGFTPSDFEGLDFAIVRPGAGILHDCIAHQLPIICISEPNNLEMAWNAKQIACRGLGVSIPLDFDATVLRSIIQEFLDPSTRDRFKNALKNEPMNGLERASELILSRL